MASDHALQARRTIVTTATVSGCKQHQAFFCVILVTQQPTSSLTNPHQPHPRKNILLLEKKFLNIDKIFKNAIFLCPFRQISSFITGNMSFATVIILHIREGESLTRVFALKFTKLDVLNFSTKKKKSFRHVDIPQVQKCINYPLCWCKV